MSFVYRRGLLALGVLAATAMAPFAAADGVSVTAPKAASSQLTTATLSRLPMTKIDVSFGTDHGALHASFTGPLLWVVLGAAQIKTGKDVVRDIVLVTGNDGYTASIALGEISPAFENKQIILAEAMNSKPLGAAHWRLVVPGDARGGRSVRDVVAIAVLAPHVP